MTYGVAIKVNEGLVFASDTRTSAGVDDVRTYNKLHTFEYPDRVLVLLTAGNLATTQSVIAHARRDMDDPAAAQSLLRVRNLFEAAEYVGQLSVHAQQLGLASGEYSSINRESTLILGGQIRGQEPGIFLIYPLGNCISASPETPYLQIGESKYGKPILDRIIQPHISLEDGMRCALVSLDSTMKSNISVGPPLDVATVPAGLIGIGRRLRLDLDTPYYAHLKRAWGEQLERVFRELPRFEWEQPASTPQFRQQQ